MQRNENRVRCGIYTRVSTKNQKEKYGLKAQIRILKEHCQRQKWESILYDEGAQSGETILYRPKLQELLKDAEVGKIDICLIIELERLSRSERLTDWEQIKESFRKGNVKIATPSQILNPWDMDDDFMLDIGGVLSKREKRMILRRMTRGKVEALRKGRCMGGTSLKYGYTSTGKKHSIKIDKEEAKVVAWCYIWYLLGFTCYGISRKLNDMKILTRYARYGWKMKKKPVSGKWRDADIYKILTYEGYTRAKVSFKFKKHHKETVQVQLPQIIPKWLFIRVQERLKQNRRKFRREEKYFYLLKGLLRCGKCGRKMYACTSRKKNREEAYTYSYYRCEGKFPSRFQSGDCDQRNIWVKRIDPQVWEKIEKIVEDPAIITDIIMAKEGLSKREETEQKNHIMQIETELIMKDLEKERILEAYRKFEEQDDGVFTFNDLQNQLHSIENRKSKLLSERNNLIESIQFKNLQQNQINNIQGYITKAKNRVSHFTDTERREFLKLLISCVVVNFNKKTNNHELELQIFDDKVANMIEMGSTSKNEMLPVVSTTGNELVHSFSGRDHQNPFGSRTNFCWKRNCGHKTI